MNGEAVTAEELARAFEADPNAANLRWGGASLQLRGRLVFAGESHAGAPMAVLDGRPDGPLRVGVHFRPEQREKVVDLQPGSLVEALATLEPFRFGTLVTLRDAVLVPPGAAAVAAEFQQLAAWAAAVGLDPLDLPAEPRTAPRRRSKKKAPAAKSKKKAATKKKPASKSKKKKPKKKPGR